MQAKVNKFVSENQDQYKSLKDLINTKINQSKLDETEERLTRLIDRVISNVNKRFMDKAETKKALQSFEKQIEQILEVLFHKVDEFEVNEAMFTKKPLGG